MKTQKNKGCDEQGNFKENRNYNETVGNNQEETVGILGKHDEEESFC